MSTKHTPLPWVVEGGIIVMAAFEKTPNGSRRLTVCRTDNLHMGEQEQGANARLIVTAVNSHHDLVEALEAVFATLNAYYGDRPESSRCESWFKARAALSKAKGE